MKRFGISVLLSAVYVGLLVYIFSSDFSKENSFLFKEAQPKSGIAVTTDPQPSTTPQNHLTTDRPVSAESVAPSTAALQDQNAMPATPEVAHDPDLQSPEGATPAADE